MMEKNSNFQEYEVFFEALLKGNRKLCSRIVNTLLKQKTDVKIIYEELLKPAMYEVGVLWERNKITVATEHMASAVTETLMNELYATISFSGNYPKTVIITCIQNELHQIGARMISDVFEMNNWQVHFLGANMPNNELIRYIGVTKPDMLAVSVSLYFNISVLEELIQVVRLCCPMLRIVVGGQAFTRGGHEFLSNYDKIVLLQDVMSMDRYLKKMQDES